MAEALQSEFGISTVPEVAESSLAILTTDGAAVADRREPSRPGIPQGQAASRDGSGNPGTTVPAATADSDLRLYQVEGDERYEVDYWCDVCAIVMFETGPCSCCQDDNRLRKRLVPEAMDGPPVGDESAKK